MDETESEKQFLIRLFKEKWVEEGGRYHGFLKSLCHIDDVVELVDKCIEAERNKANKDCQHGGRHNSKVGKK